jgi:hypothetical protein
VMLANRDLNTRYKGLMAKDMSVCNLAFLFGYLINFLKENRNFLNIFIFN